jgi:Holliday junction resolvase RusA-like endonuclease
MIKIEIKPLSVNGAWKGRRFKTKEYKQYENAVLYMLPRKYDIPDGNLEIRLRFGVSTKAFDWDNGIKQFGDILQKKYGFNDNRIYRGVVEKEIVKKGKEFVEFEIFSIVL